MLYYQFDSNNFHSENSVVIVRKSKGMLNKTKLCVCVTDWPSAQQCTRATMKQSLFVALGPETFLFAQFLHIISWQRGCEQHESLTYIHDLSRRFEVWLSADETLIIASSYRCSWASLLGHLAASRWQAWSAGDEQRVQRLVTLCAL